MKNVIAEFKAFILRGNVMDMAIGIIIGVAFGTIVSALVNDVIMPPIGFLLGNVDFSDLYANLSGTSYSSLAEARAAGAPVIAYGAFINTIINFLIIAFVLFMIIRLMNRLVKQAQKPEAPSAPITKECPFCCSNIPLKAVRCPECTSQLQSG